MMITLSQFSQMALTQLMSCVKKRYHLRIFNYVRYPQGALPGKTVNNPDCANNARKHQLKRTNLLCKFPRFTQLSTWCRKSQLSSDAMCTRTRSRMLVCTSGISGRLASKYFSIKMLIHHRNFICSLLDLVGNARTNYLATLVPNVCGGLFYYGLLNKSSFGFLYKNSFLSHFHDSGL